MLGRNHSQYIYFVRWNPKDFPIARDEHLESSANARKRRGGRRALLACSQCPSLMDGLFLFPNPSHSFTPVDVLYAFSTVCNHLLSSMLLFSKCVTFSHDLSTFESWGHTEWVLKCFTSRQFFWQCVANKYSKPVTVEVRITLGITSVPCAF